MMIVRKIYQIKKKMLSLSPVKQINIVQIVNIKWAIIGMYFTHLSILLLTNNIITAKNNVSLSNLSATKDKMV